MMYGGGKKPGMVGAGGQGGGQYSVSNSEQKVNTNPNQKEVRPEA